jgi:hypothetical protein
MTYVKVCPVCNEKNQVESLTCFNCQHNIAGVLPSDPDLIIKNREEKAVKLFFEYLGESYEITNNEIIGRSNTKINFSRLKTISREHIRVIFRGNEWSIEDMGSSNGTKINGKSCEAYTEYLISNGDKIILADDAEIVIKLQ